MSDAFTRAAAALVGDANFGLAAIYRPAAGASFACRIVLSRPVDGFGQSVATRMMASLPVADVPAPVRGDQLYIPALPLPGNTFTVEMVETDPMRAMHDLTLATA